MSNFIHKGTFARLLTGLMVAALFSAAFVVTGPSASAATGTATLTGGSLSVSAPANFNFGSVTLDGMTDQTTNGTFSIDVDDPTGANAGWRLSATLTALTDGTHTLPAATIANDTDITHTDGTGANPATNSISYPYAFPAITGTAFYNAAVNTGQGSHTYSVTITQSVPKYSYAGSYSGTLTVTIDQGPA